MNQETSALTAGLLRRLGAMLYDALLIIALWMVATVAFLPFTRAAITPGESGYVEYLYRFVLVCVLVGFFGWFWTRKGQTVGMLAWRLKVIRFDGGLMKWSQVPLRIAAAFVSLSVLALGYLWILFARDKLAWHDRWTKTKVVVVPKKGKVE